MEQSEKGFLPGCNCLVAVPPDKHFAVERLGVFQRMLYPGLNFAGFDVCGGCIQLRSITLGVEQTDCIIFSAKTRDGVYITIRLSIEHSVIPQFAKDAIYKLAQQTVHCVIQAFTANLVRSYVVVTDLERMFEDKDRIASLVQEQLGEYLQTYGIQIHGVVVTELQVSPEVMHAMNEVKKGRQLQTSLVHDAEMNKARVVKAAEAERVELVLSGERVAREWAVSLRRLRAEAEAGAEGGKAELSIEQLVQSLQQAKIVESTEAIRIHMDAAVLRLEEAKLKGGRPKDHSSDAADEIAPEELEDVYVGLLSAPGGQNQPCQQRMSM